MYEIYLDGKQLYYPGDQICTLTAALLDRKLNEAGVFNITVPPTNPLFDSFKRRISEVTVYKNNKEIWLGEVRNDGLNFKKEKTVYVVGELAYLNASSQPRKQYKYKTPLEMLTLLLNEHNSRVEKRKQFTVGMVTVGDEQYTWITNYEKTLDYIRTEMCEKLGGYLRIRKENGIRYLDLVRLQDYGKVCSQPIKFGRNLLDYASNMDADSIVTVVRPLGAKQETSEIEGVDEYLTIETVNDGKDYVENSDAIKSGIGKVWETVHFNVLTDPTALKTAGVNWLQSKQFENMVISVTAVDLSDIDVNIEKFNLGDGVRTVAKPFGMDKWSYITEQKLDLLNPVRKHNVSIGEHVKKTYTQQVIATQDEIKRQIPQNTTILELAKDNATQIIKNATEGNIHYIYDENGRPKEMLIMDTNDIKTAKKVWRWNFNGLGYSKNGYEGPYELAMTMDGAIVANMITVGIFNADLIRAGILQSADGSNKWDLENGLFTMENGKIKINGNVTKYASDYSQDDIDRANRITIGLEEPTVEDFEKLDLNGDGVINALDAVLIGRLVNGTDQKREIATSIEINPLVSHGILKTEGVFIGANGMFSKSANMEKAYMKKVYVMNEGGGFDQGASGTYTAADGKTVSVIGGIITSIV